MIILRNKLFNRSDKWDKLPPKDKRFDKNHPLVIKHGGKLTVSVDRSKKFLRQTQEANKINPFIAKIDNDRIKKLNKALKEGYIYEDGKVGGENTHYYKSKSDDNSHYLTKDISSDNRLGYRVYPPVEYSKDINDPVTTKIVLDNRSSHPK